MNEQHKTKKSASDIKKREQKMSEEKEWRRERRIGTIEKDKSKGKRKKKQMGRRGAD